jgi:hypothetical protein
MPCHAMHPIQDLFLESFSYVLEFDMHFYMHTYVDKNFILVKSGCYIPHDIAQHTPRPSVPRPVVFHVPSKCHRSQDPQGATSFNAKHDRT